MKILKLALLELLRRPKKNLIIASSIVIAVSLLTSLSIVSNSANLAIMETRRDFLLISFIIWSFNAVSFLRILRPCFRIL